MAPFKGPVGLNDLLAKVNQQVNASLAQRDEDRANADTKAVQRAKATSAKWQRELSTDIAQAGSGALDPGPVAGVSLEEYAQIAYQLGAGPAAADPVQAHGISTESWAAAVEGWNVRIASDGAIAARFASLFEEAAA
jgi:hypothetical protein